VSGLSGPVESPKPGEILSNALSEIPTNKKNLGRTIMTLMTIVMAIMLFYAAFYLWMRREARRAIVEDEDTECAMLNHCRSEAQTIAGHGSRAPTRSSSPG
jgi:hypothetical protein